MFNLAGFLGRGKVTAPVPDDSLDAFYAEDGPAQPVATATKTGAWPYMAALGLVALLATAAGGVYLFKRPKPVAAAPSASLTIESDPSGAEVTTGGVARGVTPLTLSVAPGDYVFELVHAERRKEIRAVVRAETAVVHHVQFDLPTAPVEGPATPARSTPASAPGTSGGSVPAPAGPAAGWLAVSSPIPLTVFEKGQVIGSTASERIMVPAGRRELRFVNENLGFARTSTVQVGAGRTASLSISVPKAPININAVPWAEVWIDGVRIGETPIGNYQVAIGPHELVFRHPELGERRQTATVSLTTPARVSVDMRKQ